MSFHPLSTPRRRVLSFCLLLMACALAAFAAPVAPRAKPHASNGSRHTQAATPTPSVALNTEYTFASDGSEGISPSALVQDYYRGGIFGTTYNGGSGNTGTIFDYFSGVPGSLDAFYNFTALPDAAPATNADGAYPAASFTLLSDGTLLGTTSAGGANGTGTIFRVNTDNSISTLYNFSALTYSTATGNGIYINKDGATPNTTLVSDGNGSYYGTASAGGTEALGTIFKITADGTFTVVHCFSTPEGGFPQGALTMRYTGDFFGTTSRAGANSSGTVFEFSPSCDCLTVLYAFTALIPNEVPPYYVNNDGAYPLAGLTQANDGNLYGVTSTGGTEGSGTIFELDFSSGADFPTFAVAYTFSELTADSNYDLLNPEGAGPAAPLLLGYDGFLYGTAPYGGTHGDGAIFRFDLAKGDVFPLYSFTGGSDGGQPATSLIQTSSTTFLGTTPQLTSPNGSPSGNNGTIYDLSVIPAAGVISVDPYSYSVDENAKSVTVTLTRTGGSQGVVTVHYYTQDGSAQAGTDYTARDGMFRWADGDTTNRNIVIPIVDRHFSSGSSYFFVDVDNPTGGAVTAGYSTSFTNGFVQINFNDPATKPVVTSARTARAQVGTFFSYQITADNQPASFDATGLPDGLSIDTGTGLISGTPTTAGKYTIGLSATNTGGTGTATLTLTVVPATPVITSAEVANGQVGTFFSYQITADNQPTSYAASGLPTGLSVNKTTGLISGTPTVMGTFSVSLSATNAGGTGSMTLTLTVVEASPVVTSATTARGQIGKAFTYRITASHSPDRFAATNLPAGLSINTTSGIISGTPTVAGTFSIGLSATNAGGTGTATLTLTVNPATPVITSADSASARIGKAFTYQIKATGRPASFDATGLPDGLSVDPSTGIISGTPTVTGKFTVTLSATNTGGTGTAALALTVVPATPAITSATTDRAQVGQAYTYQITASGNPASFAASVLPAGLSINGQTGLISGTPRTAGTFSIGLSATNSGGTGTATLTLDIVPATPVITSAKTATGAVGTAFSYQINATNNPDSYAAANLPAGLSINTFSGLIAGTPTAAGKFTVNLSATNAGGTGTATLALNIKAGAPVITSGLSASAQVGKAFTYQIAASNSPTSYDASGLPAGLSVDKTTGSITGTPTTAGTFTVTLSAKNASGTGTATLNLSVLPAAPIITSATQASATEGATFTYQITASNQPTSYAANGLPPGLGIDTNSGLISGAPTVAGTFAVDLAAMNAGGTGRATLTLTVTSTEPVITSALTVSAQINQPFTYQIAASNNPTSFNAANLPAGLSVNKTSGLISGTPTVSGTFNVGLSATNASGTGTATLSLTVSTAPVNAPVINSATSVNAQVGQLFTYQITATNNPTGFDATGLPAGLSINPSNGFISGTPTVSGTFNVGLSATNSGGTGTATLTLTVLPAAPVVTSATNASAQVGQPFTYQITASNKPASFGANNLPSGLSVNRATGLISGKPTVSGTFTVGLSATNAGGTGTALLSLSVTDAAPVITSATTASGQVGKAFVYQITASNNPVSYAAANLPAGLSVDTTTGLISGTPTAVGTFNVGLSATNAGGTGTGSLAISIVPAAPVITSANSASAQVGKAFSYQITASNDPTGFAASGLPDGLSVNPSSGVISGTPTVAGTFTVGLSATNAGGVGTASLSLTINAASVKPPVVTGAKSARGQVGKAFAYQIVASNDPASFAAAGLPAGLSVDPDTGLISGTPTVAGTFNVALSATNAGGTGTASLSLTILVAAPVITSATAAGGQVGQPFTYQIVATNDPASYAARGLPAGLNLDRTTGLISGASTKAGTFNVGLSAANAGGSDAVTLILTVVPASPVITSAAATAQVGKSFRYQITASNDPTSFSATGLPTGLSLDRGKGVIYGQPTATGTFDVTVTATNAGGTSSATLTLTVLPAAPVITSATSVTAQVDQMFTYQITATNDPTSYNTSPLPPNFVLDRATGLLSGPPTVTGTFTFELLAINAGGTGTASLTLTITAAPVTPPSITSARTASGRVGVPFLYQITGDHAPTSYGANALPAGLSVDNATGLISGTPMAAGTFVASVTATNAGGTGTGSLILTIADATQPQIAVVSPPDNITVVVGQTVPLAASVDDPDGVLKQVAFFVNSQPAGTVSAKGPFAVTTSPSVAGIYVLSAIATDREGRLSTASVTITAVASQVATPAPTAILLTPLNGLNVAAGSTVTLDAAAASASTVGLDHVDILVDGAVVATFDAQGNPLGARARASSSASASFASSAPSLHRQDAGTGTGGLFQASYQLPGLDKLLSMIVAATDKLGQTSLTPVASFHSTLTADRAPRVAFANLPASVQVAVGAPHQAQVEASDPDATAAAASASASGRVHRQDASSDAVLAQLTYFLNGVNIGQSSTPPFGFSFAAPAPGKYTLHAVATDGSGLSSVSEPVLVEALVPTVTVSAGGDGQAVEGGEKGKVIFARTGETSAPLTVFYKTKGSAVAGVDYQALPGSVVIPAGASQVKVKVKPVDDALRQSAPRKAKLKLLPSAEGLYQVGSPFLARISLVDDD